jgi:hypothetical protein
MRRCAISVGEAGQGACFGLSGAVFVDDSAQLGIAVEGGPGDPGELGDGGEGDLLVGLE